jgi:hypothetical protein
LDTGARIVVDLGIGGEGCEPRWMRPRRVWLGEGGCREEVECNPNDFLCNS